MADICTLLVVDDQGVDREAIAETLRSNRFNVVTADRNGGFEYLDDPIDLVLAELRTEDDRNLELLTTWKKRWPTTPFIMAATRGAVAPAVKAMKMGADECLCKPLYDDMLLRTIRKHVRQGRDQRAALDELAEGRAGFDRIIGHSQAMMEVFERARRSAAAECTVLITGESGTGKELIAEAVHRNSPRRNGPLVVINMAAVPETLVESELFGHIKGVFTGAVTDRVGRFEAAAGGTIFMDEIGDLQLTSQAKLLRVLENRKITPIGSNTDREIDVRVVAATSRNLERMVAEGSFREDLYYRLNVVNVPLPPLRERREDIVLLMDYFLDELCRTNGKPRLSYSDDLVRFFRSYDWPGNVRQLRNCIESMVVLARSTTLTLDDLPACLRSREPNLVSFESLESRTKKKLQKHAVMEALERCGGNRTRAAESLGISVRTLQRKLKRWQQVHRQAQAAEEEPQPAPDAHELQRSDDPIGSDEREFEAVAHVDLGACNGSFSIAR